MIRGALMLLLWSAAASAQQLPALYSVTGVAGDDVLNIRALPDAASDIIGSLGPDATGVEVVAISADGRWGQINTGERAGWSSLGYLTLERAYPDPAAAPLTCFGTEPFWSLTSDRAPANELVLRTLDDATRWDTQVSLQSRNRSDRFSILGVGGQSTIAVVLSRGICSDGMSDQVFGLSAEVILPEAQSHLTGCCSLSR